MVAPTRQQVLQAAIARCGILTDAELDWSLIDLALTHPSLSPSHNNDRLEFLGDAILRLLVGDFLYSSYPELPVGDLALLRSNLLSNVYFSKLAAEFDLDSALHVGGSARHDKKGRKKRMADAFEAIVGALYLSLQTTPEGLSKLKQWLRPHLYLQATAVLADMPLHNAKTTLQELTQKHWGELPSYRCQVIATHSPQPAPEDTGQAEPAFVAEVWAKGQLWGEGRGSSKKGAESAAALAAFKAINVMFAKQDSAP